MLELGRISSLLTVRENWRWISGVKICRTLIYQILIIFRITHCLTSSCPQDLLVLVVLIFFMVTVVYYNNSQ